MNKYLCFRSHDYENDTPYVDVFDDTFVYANDQHDAKMMLAEMLARRGCKNVTLTETQNEVYGTYNGIEIVYYGFDEE